MRPRSLVVILDLLCYVHCIADVHGDLDVVERLSGRGNFSHEARVVHFLAVQSFDRDSGCGLDIATASGFFLLSRKIQCRSVAF